MHEMWSSMKAATNRRSFLKNGLATAAGVGLLANNSFAQADDDEKGEHSGRLTFGDAAMLRFAAAAEIIETDFWVQYNELCGVQDREEPDGTGNPAFTNALSFLDSDMAQYVHDNTDDEFTHWHFLNAYLVSKGADPVSLEPFRTLPGSMAKGSSGKKRITNLMQLTVDTSWWNVAPAADANNPDAPTRTPSFLRAIDSLTVGEHTTIPRTNEEHQTSKLPSAKSQEKRSSFPASRLSEQGGTAL